MKEKWIVFLNNSKLSKFISLKYSLNDLEKYCKKLVVYSGNKYEKESSNIWYYRSRWLLPI